MQPDYIGRKIDDLHTSLKELDTITYYGNCIPDIDRSGVNQTDKY